MAQQLHTPGPARRHRRLDHPPVSRPLVLLASLAALLLAGCEPTAVVPVVSPTPSATPTSTATATAVPVDPACAATLPSGGPIRTGAPLVDPLDFPPGTIAAAARQTAGGTDLFTLFEFDACSPQTTPGAVSTYLAANLPALPQAWASSPQFPYDAGLMGRCTSASCWSVTGAVPYVYVAFERLTNAGQGAVTYHVRYAVSPDPGSCALVPGSGPYDFFVPDFGLGPQVPLPPMSRAGENDAPHLRAWEVCSPGTAASITAFMAKELPATGWKPLAASNPSCAFASCWSNAGRVVSWSVTDPATPMQWFVGFR